ncbi:MAG TPA: DUF6807 family protein [Candidatus Limnocylindria bacterium]|nr:DUF6807 family protein [Candidatus Limnocylindria bacterium]
MKALFSTLLTVLFLAGCATRHTAEVLRDDSSVKLKRDGREVFTYNLVPPPGVNLPVDAGGFFHPLTTPNGVVVTDLSPSDHRHHRGVFLAWVEMHGAKDADFWGWGQYAPVKDRRIVNRSVTMQLNGFTALNEWVAEGSVLVEEELQAVSTAGTGANLLELTYKLTPKSDLTLSQWAFSGFCLRVRKDGDMRIFSPTGLSMLPNPNHMKPESDWPDARWYRCEQTLPDGSHIGAAIINHSSNPPSLWHNHRDVRMLNPCIVAPGPVKLAGGKTLVLRYLVVTHDGSISADYLDGLSADFSKRWP